MFLFLDISFSNIILMAYESGNVRPGANTNVDIYSLFLTL